ncbi:MAG TPA: hypothetical protein VHH13_12505, partial [Arthrobacter sp.]|nr:hypothetical protein [Arthrobacter sp.]
VLFTDGLLRHFLTEIVVGIVMTLILALLMDLVLVGLEHLLTPWNRHRKAGRKQVTASPGPDNSRADGVPAARRPDAAETAVLHESL